MKRYFSCTLLFLLIQQINYSQQISGFVFSDTLKTPLEFAVISVKGINDSVEISAITTDARGFYKFTKLAKGQYLVSASHIGFNNYNSALLSLDTTNIQHDIFLTSEVNQTKTVSVVAKKSIFKQEAGKTTVDVKNMTSATGLMALDLLRRMPGVMVDNNDNITLKGKSNVSVMFNNKMIYMSTRQVATILKSMPASEVDNIEIISSPSAKYDAQGTGGIININLKKSAKKGFYGDVQGNYGQGFYAKKSAGLNLAYNAGKWNWNASVNMNSNHNRAVSNNYRTFGSIDSSMYYDQKAVFESHNNSQSYSLGASYDVNSKLNIAVSHFGVLWNGDWNSEDGSSIVNAQGKTSQNNETRVKEPYNGYSFTTGSSFNYKLDSTGSVSGGVNHNTEFNASYLDAYVVRSLNGSKDTAFFTSSLPGLSNNYSANIDFERKYYKKLHVESGIKYYHNQNDFDLDYDITQKTVFVPAIPASVLYTFKEHVAAAYFQGAWNEEKWGVKGGLRSEYWLANGDEKLSKSSFERNLLQFFPSSSVSYNASAKHNISFAYNKRISRPDGRLMSPVSYFTDAYSFFSGNPKVLPSTSHNFELSHSYRDGALITSVAYNKAKNTILEWAISQRDSSNVQDMTAINIPLTEGVSLSTSLYVPVKKWWTIQFFGIVNTNRTAGYLSNLRENVDFTYTTANFSTTQTFTLPKKWSIELTGFYQLKHLYGYTINNHLGSVGLSVKKDIFTGRGTIKLNCQDLFHTFKYSGISNINGFVRSYLYYWDNRVVYLSFTWKLGSKWFMDKEAKSNNPSGGGR